MRAEKGSKIAQIKALFRNENGTGLFFVNGHWQKVTETLYRTVIILDICWTEHVKVYLDYWRKEVEE